MIPTPPPILGYTVNHEVAYGRADAKTLPKDLGFHIYNETVLTIPSGLTYIERPDDSGTSSTIFVYQGPHKKGQLQIPDPDAHIAGWFGNSAVLITHGHILIVDTDKSGAITRTLSAASPTAGADWNGAVVNVQQTQKKGQSQYRVTQTLANDAIFTWTIQGQFRRFSPLGARYLCLQTDLHSYVLDSTTRKVITLDPDLDLSPGPTPDTVLGTKSVDLPHSHGRTQILQIQLPSVRTTTLAAVDGYAHFVTSGPTIPHPLLLVFPHSHGQANLEELEPNGRLKTLQEDIWDFHPVVPGVYSR